ncbi:mechanosensitive ion channel protein 6-like isoform X2 [Argentina anserina]|uniref:mechanosensitive ion channel protein 6-like isoform X2 n=1 Tax=Argentina anserina TaxID=57926 RepID=UPI0021767A0F|nr:mechanosensitive ion channel protein 6-like isoform X2 [Potentilla anserina]
MNQYCAMDFSLKKTFKSHGSSKHMRKISAGSVEDTSHEELPILNDHHTRAATTSDLPDHRKEVIVKIDEGSSSVVSDSAREVDPTKHHVGKIWGENSIDLWTEDERSNTAAGSGGFQFAQKGRQTATPEEDPPTKLIGQFLNKQRGGGGGGDVSLDMDLEMDELQKPPLAESPRISQTSRELKVSFQSPAPSDLPDMPNDSVRRRNRDSVVEDERRRSDRLSSGGADVLKCTSNKSFRREMSFQNNNKSDLLRMKTKSRLMDPPEGWDDGRVPKSGPMRSGMLGKGGGDDDDDDPFLEEDLPDEYKNVNFNALTFLQWLSLVLIIAALVCSLCIRVLRQMYLWKLKLWKWEVLILVSICGRLVSGWVIKIMVFFVERNFLLRKRVLYFVYGIRKPVQNCIWLGFVLLAWHFMLIRKVEEETNNKTLEYVTKGLLCLLIGVLLWLVKTLVVKVLASSFHVRSYFDRIQDALFNQYVIQTLSGRPLIEVQNAEDEEERFADEVRKLQSAAGVTMSSDLRSNAFPSARIGRAVGSGSGRSGPLIAASGGLAAKSSKFPRPTMSKKSEEASITIDHLHRLNPRNVSAWNMKRLMNIVRKGHLTTLDEQILDTTEPDEGDTKIKSEVEAKAAAKQIFRNVARPGSKYICMEDLLRFMGEEEALKTMSLFEGSSETRRIRKTSLKNWVVNCFRERRALALTLNDTKTAVNRLRIVVDVLVGIVIVIIWLLVLNIVTSENIVFATSQLVVVAFVFGKFPSLPVSNSIKISHTFVSLV